MKRYFVEYIERGGGTAGCTVSAKSKGEARRLAADRGCEDVVRISRIGFPYGMVVSVVVICLIVLYVAIH